MSGRGRNQDAEKIPERQYRGPEGGVFHPAPAHNANHGTNYGAIYQHNTSINAPIYREAMDIVARLNPILDASHTRNLEYSPPKSECLEGTRLDFIAKVLSWARAGMDGSNPAHILWIYGYAGCGKSAISLAVAQQLAEEGLLAASFFFFRGAGDRNRVVRLIATIVWQMVDAIPATLDLVEGALKRNPSLASSRTASLKTQFTELVLKPILAISALLQSGPLTILLDGVDECEDHDEVGRLIVEMIACFNKHPFAPLRFIIASRVEDHLHRRLHSSKQVRLLDLVDHTSNDDIEAALESRFKEERSRGVAKYNNSWPSEGDKRRLVKHIGKSFIFMTTILGELFKPFSRDGMTPMDRLPLLLSMEPNFDDLYKSILAPLKDAPHLLGVLNTIALAEMALSIAQISDLLDIKATDVAGVLLALHAIMRIPGDDRSPVTLWHTSFRDFLCTADRAGRFFTAPAYHWRIAYRTARIVTSSADTPSPASQYAERFCLRHLELYLETHDDSIASITMLSKEVIPDLVKASRSGGRTALEVACVQPNWELVCALVNGGADANTRFTYGYTTTFGDAFYVALHVACYYNAKDVINLLLDKGADPNVLRATTYKPPCPTYSQHDKPVDERAARFWAYTSFPLAWASLHGDVDLVQKLLRHGANPSLTACDPDSKYPLVGSALHCASAGAGDAWYKIVRILLEHGADFNLADDRGQTPLHRACKSGRLESVQILLDYGADPNIKTTSKRKIIRVEELPLLQKSSPLSYSNLAKREPGRYARLYMAGAFVIFPRLVMTPPSTIGSRGDTPLHYAYFYGRPEVAELLLRRNADPSIRNEWGSTPLQIARRRGEDGELHPCYDTSSSGVRF